MVYWIGDSILIPSSKASRRDFSASTQSSHVSTRAVYLFQREPLIGLEPLCCGGGVHF